MASNKYYKKIIEILSKKKFVTRLELAKMLNINSGGSLSNVLLDLEKCGFINKYHPFNLKEGSVLTRCFISDNYLQYYFKFIKSLQKNIDNGEYNQNPQMAIKVDNYIKWLGFSGIKYEHGVYFSRSAEKSNKTIHKVLICNMGAEKSLLNRAYFDNIITCDDIIAASDL